MKLKRDQQRWMEHLQQHGTPRGMTLGRGKPHDRRTLQTLIDLYLIKPVFGRSDILQDEYAVRGEEDSNGLALLVCPNTGCVTGATHYGCRVRPFDESDYDRDESGSALQNGIDTARECYRDDEVRREWMQWATARSTLAMQD